MFRNRPIEAISARHALSDETSLPQGYPENLVLLNQPGSFQDSIFRNPLPANLEQSKEDKAQFRQAVNSEIGNRFGILEYADNDQQDDDSVVIDAGDHLSDEEGDSAEGDAEGKITQILRLVTFHSFWLLFQLFLLQTNSVNLPLHRRNLALLLLLDLEV